MHGTEALAWSSTSFKNRVQGVDFLRMAGFAPAGLLTLAVIAALWDRFARCPRPLTPQ